MFFTIVCLDKNIIFLEQLKRLKSNNILFLKTVVNET